jgi:hypothetical protein
VSTKHQKNLICLHVIFPFISSTGHNKYWILDFPDYEQFDMMIKSAKKLTDQTEFSLNKK